MAERSQSSSRRQDYFREHWNDEIPTDPSPVTRAATKTHRKKKQSRGNRPLQRYRAKLRRQGLTEEAIARLINEQPRVPSHQVTVQQQPVLPRTTTVSKTNKRKRVPQSTHLPTSISQVTLAPPASKRQRSITVATGGVTNELDIGYQPHYLNVPDQRFKKMLRDALVGAEAVVEGLDSTAKLQYTRKYAHLVNRLFFLRLKLDYWTYYHTIVKEAGIVSMALSDTMLKEYHLHRIEFVSEMKMQQREEKLKQQLKETEDQVERHKQLGEEMGIDMKRLVTVIPAFVRRGQHRLTADFEEKKLFLQMDIHDYRCIEAFNKLHPTEEQIMAAKVIWQATMKKQEQENYLAILKQRIYTKRLPASFNLIDHSVDDTEKLLAQPGLHEDKRVTLSDRRQKIIAQFKYDLMAIQMTTVEELIRHHLNTIAEEKQTLVASAQGQQPLPQQLVAILHAIGKRQTNIVRRLKLINRKKLSHFDDAPMATDNNNDVAGSIGAMS